MLFLWGSTNTVHTHFFFWLAGLSGASRALLGALLDCFDMRRRRRQQNNPHTHTPHATLPSTARSSPRPGRKAREAAGSAAEPGRSWAPRPRAATRWASARSGGRADDGAAKRTVGAIISYMVRIPCEKWWCILHIYIGFTYLGACSCLYSIYSVHSLQNGAGCNLS